MAQHPETAAAEFKAEEAGETDPAIIAFHAWQAARAKADSATDEESRIVETIGYDSPRHKAHMENVLWPAARAEWEALRQVADAPVATSAGMVAKLTIAAVANQLEGGDRQGTLDEETLLRLLAAAERQAGVSFGVVDTAPYG